MGVIVNTDIEVFQKCSISTEIDSIPSRFIISDNIDVANPLS